MHAVVSPSAAQLRFTVRSSWYYATKATPSLAHSILLQKLPYQLSFKPYRVKRLTLCVHPFGRKEISG